MTDSSPQTPDQVVHLQSLFETRFGPGSWEVMAAERAGFTAAYEQMARRERELAFIQTASNQNFDNLFALDQWLQLQGLPRLPPVTTATTSTPTADRLIRQLDALLRRLQGGPLPEAASLPGSHPGEVYPFPNHIASALVISPLKPGTEYPVHDGHYLRLRDDQDSEVFSLFFNGRWHEDPLTPSEAQHLPWRGLVQS